MQNTLYSDHLYFYNTHTHTHNVNTVITKKCLSTTSPHFSLSLSLSIYIHVFTNSLTLIVVIANTEPLKRIKDYRYTKHIIIQVWQTSRIQITIQTCFATPPPTFCTAIIDYKQSPWW